MWLPAFAGGSGGSPMEKTVKQDFWESRGHFGKTGQEKLCVGAGNSLCVQEEQWKGYKRGDLLPADRLSFCSGG